MTNEKNQRTVFLNCMQELDKLEFQQDQIREAKKDIYARIKDVGLRPKAVRAYRSDIAKIDARADVDEEIDKLKAWWESRHDFNLTPPTHGRAGARASTSDQKPSQQKSETTDGSSDPAVGEGNEGAAAVHPAEVTAPRADAPSEPDERTSAPTGVHVDGAEGDGPDSAHRCLEGAHGSVPQPDETSLPAATGDMAEAPVEAEGAGEPAAAPAVADNAAGAGEPAPTISRGSAAREAEGNTPVATSAQPDSGSRDAGSNSGNNTIGTAPRLSPEAASAGREGASKPAPPSGERTPRREPRRPRVVPTDSSREQQSRAEGAADKAPSAGRIIDGFSDFPPIPPALRRQAAE